MIGIFVISIGILAQDSKPETLSVNVPATANPYLAGMPSRTKAREGDSAPQQSPILVERSLSHAVSVAFSATGSTEHTPHCPPDCTGPNGAAFARHRGGAEHGVSDVVAPIDGLIGVFLSDEQPDRSGAPPGLDFSTVGDFRAISPKLKQVFFIGSGRSKAGVVRRYLVPAKATRLYLAVMDAYEWNNNSGSYTVIVAIERDQVDTGMFAVDSSISFAKWACVPDRERCTPDRAVAEEKTPGEFHVILPASSEWSISVPDPHSTAKIHSAEGTVCLSAQACSGPAGSGSAAGAGFLQKDKLPGALISKTIEGRVYFSVNHLAGAAFRDHEGYFEFDVSVH